MHDASSRGLADPVLDAQAIFRAVMDAFACPGSIRHLSALPVSPPGLPAALAAIALTLADHETTLWLDPALAADPAHGAYLAFHTGARILADPADAAFALATDLAALPPLAAFAVGEDDYPDRSTTIIAAVGSLSEDGALRLTGPGIASSARLGVAPWPEGFSAALAGNRALFPRGVDLVLCAGEAIVALPRTTRIEEV